MTQEYYLPRLAPKFAETLRSKDLKNVLATGGDAFLGLPVFGLLGQAGDLTMDFRRQLELRKIAIFLSELAETTKADRERFIHQRKLDEDPQKFVENILLLLGRYDDMAKAKIAGKIWASHIRGNMAFDVAKRLTTIINHCYIDDLDLLNSMQANTFYPSSDKLISLYNAGLLEQHFVGF